jgi:methionyl-tRNA formyltransferase
VSQPDRPRGRGRKLEPTPVGACAARLGLPLLQPERVGEPAALDWMRARAPELGVVVAFGQFIPKPVRELPPHGLINAHASLLPRWRGAAPIAHAILAGDAKTGVTIMRVAREMDAGDWCLARETPIGPEETAGELSERLAALAAGALLEAVDAIAAGRARFQPQDPAGVTLAPKIDRPFGRIGWSEPAAAVLRRIRAATPWPGADLRLRRSGLAFRILRAGLDSGLGPPARPGTVRTSEGKLRIRALDGWLAVQRVQAPGRRPADTAEFLRGARIPDDEEVLIS